MDSVAAEREDSIRGSNGVTSLRVSRLKEEDTWERVA